MFSTVMRRVVAAVALAVVALVASGPAVAAYPPGGPILDLSDRDLPPNTPFVATVAGCQIGEDVTFFLDGASSGPAGFRRSASAGGVTVTCMDDGTGRGVATTTLTSPGQSGTYDVRAVLSTTGVTLTDTIRVRTDGSIPRTGTSGIAPASLIGGGLLALGAALFVVARIRRRDPAPAAT